MKTIIFDISKLNNKAECMQTLAEQFNLPNNSGENLDSIWDLLGEKHFDEDLIIIMNYDEKIQEYGQKTLKLLEKLASNHENITLIQ